VRGGTIAPVASFAIADFDGDQRPDLADVLVGQNSYGGAGSYRIELQLSAVGLQSVRVLAPAGGLRIEARDVNGDRAVDLVLSSAWLSKPVAILLNDGRGGFSQVEPTAFAGAFADATTNWVSSSNQLTQTVGVPPQLRRWISSEVTNPPDVCRPTDSTPSSSSGFLLNPFLISNLGRAPPFEVPYL
jgi:hypothetical protein